MTSKNQRMLTCVRVPPLRVEMKSTGVRVPQLQVELSVGFEGASGTDQQTKKAIVVKKLMVDGDVRR